MPFVMDASIIAAWALPDESGPDADRIIDRLAAEDAIAPRLWQVEPHNLRLEHPAS